MDGNRTSITPYVYTRIIRSCCMSMISFLVIFGNATCLFILHRATCRNMGFRETTKVFMISLTCTDFCSGIVGVLPVSITAALGHFPTSQSSSVPFCFYQALICYFLSLLSCSSLLAVTTERYLSIVYPLRSRLLVTTRRCKIAVIFLWTIQGLILIGFVISLTPKYAGSDATIDPDFLLCFPHIVEENGDLRRYPTFFSLGAIFAAIPVLTIIFMYTKMLLIARRRSSSLAGKTSASVTERQATLEWRGIVTFLIITITSITAWLPYTIVTFQEYIMLRVVDGHWKFLSVTFFFCGGWFNVAIYYMGNKRYRLIAKQMIYSIVSDSNNSAITTP